MDKKFSLVGGGNMAEAFISQFIIKSICAPEAVTVSGPRLERAEHFRSVYGTNAITDNVACILDSDVIVLCIKPDLLEYVAKQLRGFIPATALVVSLLAGKSVETLRELLSHKAIVRAMPNAPAKTGDGFTVWVAEESLDQKHVALAQTILSAIGIEMQVSYEHLLDKATAVSGSGPGFVFLFMEALEQGALHIGMSHHLAHTSVLEMVLGAANYAKKNGKSFAELRAEVSSPGGTTVYGIHELEKLGVRAAIVEAILAAHGRCLELGK